MLYPHVSVLHPIYLCKSFLLSNNEHKKCLVVYDKWLKLHYPSIPLVRYADDVVIHCQSLTESKEILERIKERLSVCKLTAHPEKTRIVYCKKSGRNLKGHPVQFDFLGFSFQPLTLRLKKRRNVPTV